MSARRRTRRRWVLWGAVLTVAYGAACWFAAEMLLTPERRLPSVEAGTAFGAAELQDVELVTADGLRLAVWVREPVGEAHGTVLLFHAKDGCRQASRLAFVAQRGFRGLAVDARAHGASEGEWTTFGWDERLDVEAAWAYARERWGDEPLIAWGTSQGAAAVLYFVDEFADANSEARPPTLRPIRRTPLDGLILESLYVDIDTAFRNRVSHRLGAWAMPFAWPVRQLVSVRSGIDRERLAPARILRRLTAPPSAGGTGTLAGVPILIATGAEDVYATPAEAEALRAAAAPGQARLILVAGRGHEELLGGTGSVYSAAVDGLLARFR